MPDKYDYERFGSKAKRVGQAVSDILNSSTNVLTTAGDVIEGYKHKFTEELEKTIKDNVDRYDDPFYVLVLTKKEMWADNMVRNWFVARQTRPRSVDMMGEYANHTKTLYKVNKARGDVNLVWTLPGYEECKTVINNQAMFDCDLVNWVKGAINGTLDAEIV